MMHRSNQLVCCTHCLCLGKAIITWLRLKLSRVGLPVLISFRMPCGGPMSQPGHCHLMCSRGCVAGRKPDSCPTHFSVPILPCRCLNLFARIANCLWQPRPARG